MSAESDLGARLRLIVLTHPEPSAGSTLDVVAECLDAGCPAIQLRDKTCSADELCRQAASLRELTRDAGALLIINDRLDVALAVDADGVHLGPRDIPVHAVRRQVDPSFLIGYSTDDPDTGRRAAAAGADYLGVGAVYGTTSKARLEDEAIGPDRVREVSDASGLPCVGIGGITTANAGALAAVGAGVAVLGAVMLAARPGDVVRQLLTELSRAESAPARDRTDD